jgi:hypothetical protein
MKTIPFSPPNVAVDGRRSDAARVVDDAIQVTDRVVRPTAFEADWNKRLLSLLGV